MKITLLYFILRVIFCKLHNDNLNLTVKWYRIFKNNYFLFFVFVFSHFIYLNHLVLTVH